MTTLIEVPEAEPGIVAPKSKSKAGGGLGRYIVVRFFLIIPTIFILVTLVFFLMRVIGDPITASQGGRLPPDVLAQRIQEAGYDRPVLVQYFEYLGQLITGNFGTTITDRRPVVEVLTTFGAATLELSINALIVALAVGIPFGLVAAQHRDKTPDAFLRFFAILCYATPVFFSGLLLKLTFSYGLVGSLWQAALPPGLNLP